MHRSAGYVSGSGALACVLFIKIQDYKARTSD
jgi:hypothetical protein